MHTDQIGHINCHATSTPLGDQIELSAIKSVFGQSALSKLAITSTKSSTGHLLGAAGSTEAIFTLLAAKNGIIPPTLNLQNSIEPTMNIVFQPNTEWEQKEHFPRIAITNSFGFGGTNASLVMSQFVE